MSSRKLTVTLVGIVVAAACTFILVVGALQLAHLGMRLFASYSAQWWWAPAMSSFALFAACIGSMLHRKRVRRMSPREGSRLYP